VNLEVISLSRLLVAFLPVALVIGIFWHWRLGVGKASLAVARMLVQLLLIGFVLVYIFEAESSLVVVAVILLMVSVSAWIALNTVPETRRGLYAASLVSIAVGGGLSLWLTTQWVLELPRWFEPRYVIPLAGMTFANAMTSVSLAAERFESELSNGALLLDARNTAFQAGMIPVINALLAVGLVSLPGMMTGQILSGVSPLVAARYQIMVMCLIFASAGLSTALFLVLRQRGLPSGE
jgi:putative ABC transport system permease protein